MAQPGLRSSPEVITLTELWKRVARLESQLTSHLARHDEEREDEQEPPQDTTPSVIDEIFPEPRKRRR